jgi:SAM-dependent methyltransferase
MDVDEYRRLVEATESHWWFDATSQLLEQLAREHLERAGADARCLDAGGGSGATGSWLARSHWTLLAEVEPVAIDAAVARYPYRAVFADINHLPLAGEQFDLVLCVTALCHEMNTDPAHTVREFARVLRPGGLLIVLEPHHQWLWRGHDRVTHTARRFNLPTLRSLMADAGLRVERATGAYTFLVPPALLLRLIERGKTSSDVGRNQSGLGGVAGRIAAAERRVLRRTNLPFGLSAVIVAAKPSA